MNNSIKYPNLLIKTQNEGKIWIISINRPNQRNCVNPSTAEELYDAF